MIVWEKAPNGGRAVKRYDAPYYFYVADDENPTHVSISGVSVRKVVCRSASDLDTEVTDYRLRGKQLFESDFTPLERVLMDNYGKSAVPELNIGFIDIEVDYDPDIGFAGPQNPYAPINAVTLIIGDSTVTIAVPPKLWNGRELPDHLKDVILVDQEVKLLELLLDFIAPCDVLSGWNSEFYDMPYIARRVELVLGERGLQRLAFEGGPPPRWTEMARFKKSTAKETAIDLMTRVHLDYLRLFQKFDLTKRQSYSLNNVAFEELGERKVEYDGSLHELYNKDFPKFLDYNIYDVRLLVKMDAKRKYIELANQMVHMATVNFDAVFGSVQLIDSAIINYSHNVRNQVVFDRAERGPGTAKPVEGAIVVTPNVGFYRWVGACDINSLYPSTIRSLNLSREKLVAQVLRVSNQNDWNQVALPRADATAVVAGHLVTCIAHENEHSIRAKWTYYVGPDESEVDDENERFGFAGDLSNATFEATEYAWKVVQRASQEPDSIYGSVLLDIVFDGYEDELTMPASVLIEQLKANKLAISAYGTIIDQSSPGLVPEVLTSWFKGRKEMQAEKKKYGKLKDKLLSEGKTATDAEVLEAARLETYYDMLQGVRKVLLNSTYGAMLNGFCRFGDQRIGASVTFTGRQITSHMINTVSTWLDPDAPKIVKAFDPHTKKDSKTGTDGVHDLRWGSNTYTVELKPSNMPGIRAGTGPIYGDTDSVYFTYNDIIAGETNVDVLVETANAIAEGVNDSFPEFMRTAFNCQPAYDDLIKANRELVCKTGLIQAKKKYMMLVVDKEGKRVKAGDDDELKTMGSDIKLSSTPTIIKDMLTDVVMGILNELPKKTIDQVIIDFRKRLADQGDAVNPLDLASVVSVNNVDEYTALWRVNELNASFRNTGAKKAPRVKMGVNVRSTINHNHVIEVLGVKDQQAIKSGDKIKLIWLKPNEYGFTSMAFASEVEHLPKWFTDNFEVDLQLTEEKLVDNKLELIFGALGWEIPTFQSQLVESLLEF